MTKHGKTGLELKSILSTNVMPMSMHCSCRKLSLLFQMTFSWPLLALKNLWHCLMCFNCAVVEWNCFQLSMSTAKYLIGLLLWFEGHVGTALAHKYVGLSYLRGTYTHCTLLSTPPLTCHLKCGTCD